MIDDGAVAAGIIAQEHATIGMSDEGTMQPTYVGAGGTQMAHGIPADSEFLDDDGDDLPMIRTAHNDE